jgi:hypothetical protein
MLTGKQKRTAPPGLPSREVEPVLMTLRQKRGQHGRRAYHINSVFVICSGLIVAAAVMIAVYGIQTAPARPDEVAVSRMIRIAAARINGFFMAVLPFIQWLPANAGLLSGHAG